MNFYNNFGNYKNDYILECICKIIECFDDFAIIFVECKAMELNQ